MTTDWEDVAREAARRTAHEALQAAVPMIKQMVSVAAKVLIMERGDAERAIATLESAGSPLGDDDVPFDPLVVMTHAIREADETLRRARAAP